MNSKLPDEILRYLALVERDEPRQCREQHALVRHIRNCFATEDIYVDAAQLANYLHIVRYFPFEKLFPWEEFVLRSGTAHIRRTKRRVGKRCSVWSDAAREKTAT